MPPPETSGTLLNQIPLSVITAREPVVGNRWIDERWTVAGVVAAGARHGEKITRRLLRSSVQGEHYLWTGFLLRLHPYEADGYYYNIIGQNPSLYVYCEHDDSGEPRPRSITAEYIDALSHSETGNATFAVPMPPEVYRIVEQFVVQHFVPDEPKMKRKRDRENKRTGIWEDD